MKTLLSLKLTKKQLQVLYDVVYSIDDETSNWKPVLKSIESSLKKTNEKTSIELIENWIYKKIKEGLFNEKLIVIRKDSKNHLFVDFIEEYDENDEEVDKDDPDILQGLEIYVDRNKNLFRVVQFYDNLTEYQTKKEVKECIEAYYNFLTPKS